LTSEEGARKLQRAGAAFDRIIGNMAGGAANAWLTLLTGSPETASFAGGAIGPVAEEFSFAIRTILTKQDKKLHQMILAAEEVGGEDGDVLAGALESDAKAELLLRSTEAAARSPHPTHLRFVAGLFASGMLATDDTVVDQSLLAVAAARELDVSHLRLLDLLRRPCPTWREPQDLRRRLRFSWDEEAIARSSSGLKLALPALTAKLESLGLVRDRGLGSFDYEPMWELTSFGRLCVSKLEEIAESEGS
jgi:hypothetical protein